MPCTMNNTKWDFLLCKTRFYAIFVNENSCIFSDSFVKNIFLKFLWCMFFVCAADHYDNMESGIPEWSLDLRGNHLASCLINLLRRCTIHVHGTKLEGALVYAGSWTSGTDEVCKPSLNYTEEEEEEGSGEVRVVCSAAAGMSVVGMGGGARRRRGLCSCLGWQEQRVLL